MTHSIQSIPSSLAFLPTPTETTAMAIPRSLQLNLEDPGWVHCVGSVVNVSHIISEATGSKGRLVIVGWNENG